MSQNRRQFVREAGTLALGLALMPRAFASVSAPKASMRISLAEWSLHKSLWAKKMTNLDFPRVARETYGIDVVEYVNQFFKDKAEDTAYLNDLLQRCKDNGITNHLIMIDGEGGLGELDEAKRHKAVQNHHRWVHAAKHLGCQTIRVNAYGVGNREDVQKAAVDGLSRLGEYAKKENINVIVENHGGFSSDGQWLAGVMKQVNMSNVGTLPDFGNFCIKREQNGCAEWYDRYQGTKELMPYSKGVSAKTYDFDKKGNCVETDYTKIMKIVKDAGFNGYVGIEYEGDKLSEEEGIKMTKALLERVGKDLGFNMNYKRS